MNHVLQLVRDILETHKMSAEMQLQLNKICELEDAFVKADPSIVASTMVDECYYLDDLTVEEMAEAEREERAVWENIYGKYMTKRGDK